MQGLVKETLGWFMFITVLTALTTIGGIIYVWIENKGNLPYLQTLTVVVIIEIVGVSIILARRGLKYLPETKTNETMDSTLQFMLEFISSGSSATIVSNRVSWLMQSPELLQTLKKKIDEGLRVEIITPHRVAETVREELERAIFIVTGEQTAPYSRFTLVNGDRNGAEKLAIARGSHPNHEITIFDNNSGPQMIGMAKDIIRKSRELNNAA